MSVYYNEIEPYAAQWLRNLMAKGLIPDGEVDTRSIVDVSPDDLRNFTQCHFFAGIGGWSRALRLAGWPDDREIWTGSCPCQPFSVAGKGLGAGDPRHLWPHFHRLIAARRPPVVFGEQVSGAAGYGWLDGVRSDLAREDYACKAFDIPACAVDAPHIRNRLYWIAENSRDRVLEYAKNGGRRKPRDMVSAKCPFETEQVEGRFRSAAIRSSKPVSNMADADRATQQRRRHQLSSAEGQEAGWGDHRPWGIGTFWSDAVWLPGADGKARRAQPSIPLLAHGVSARVGRLRAYGNAIVPQLAAEVIGAFMDVYDA